MNGSSRNRQRVLAIDPTSKGFGFAVLEGPDALIDWGVRHAGADRNRKSLARAEALIGQYRPDVLVVEHTGAKGSRRRPRVRRLVKSLAALARRRHLRSRRIPRRGVKRCFAETVNKHQIAVALTERFPELAPHLPRERTRREAGNSEDERMSYFDAVAFAVASFAPRRAPAPRSVSSPATLPDAA